MISNWIAAHPMWSGLIAGYLISAYLAARTVYQDLTPDYPRRVRVAMRNGMGWPVIALAAFVFTALMLIFGGRLRVFP